MFINRYLSLKTNYIDSIILILPINKLKSFKTNCYKIVSTKIEINITSISKLTTTQSTLVNKNICFQ